MTRDVNSRVLEPGMHELLSRYPGADGEAVEGANGTSLTVESPALIHWFGCFGRCWSTSPSRW